MFLNFTKTHETSKVFFMISGLELMTACTLPGLISLFREELGNQQTKYKEFDFR